MSSQDMLFGLIALKEVMLAVSANITCIRRPLVREQSVVLICHAAGSVVLLAQRVGYTI